MKDLFKYITILLISALVVRNVRGNFTLEMCDPAYNPLMYDDSDADSVYDTEDGNSGFEFYVQAEGGNVHLGLRPAGVGEDKEITVMLTPAKAIKFGLGLQEAAKEARKQMPPDA